jgi:endo-1,4-beta-xylanase
MVLDFKARGVPIDGIGLQMHLTGRPIAKESIEANIKRITDLGLEVHITELDVRVPVTPETGASPADVDAQAQSYYNVVAVCLKYRRCTTIQTWGFTDRYSWIPRRFPGTGSALPFDAEYRPKAAYRSMQQAFRERQE